MWALDSSLSVCGQGCKPHLSDAETLESCFLLRTFLLSYQYAANRSLSRRELLFKLRPKLHYVDHLERETAIGKLNFIHFACFKDEDLMKGLKRVVTGTHVNAQLPSSFPGREGMSPSKLSSGPECNVADIDSRACVQCKNREEWS